MEETREGVGAFCPFVSLVIACILANTAGTDAQASRQLAKTDHQRALGRDTSGRRRSTCTGQVWNP